MKKTYSIVGTKFADAETFVASLKPGIVLTLVREPDNKHDKNAVAVYCGRKRIGYLASKVNAEIAAKIDSTGTPWTPDVGVVGDAAMPADAAFARSFSGVFKLSPNSAFPQIEVDE